MPRPRFKNLDEERRRQLLERAASEFALRGYEGASLNNIITSIGLSKGAFYYYCDDKADLFETVTRFAFEGLVGSDADAYDVRSLDRESFWPTLEGWFLELTTRLHELPWLTGLGKLYYHPPAVDGVDGIVAQHFDQVHGWLAALLRRGCEVGAVRRDVPLELLLQTVVGALEGSDQWFVKQWDGLEPSRRDELALWSFRVAQGMAATPPPDNPAQQGVHDG